ncbi:MAG: DUF4440 domain-containing protein [Gemmatimonadota bacterium]|nr:MAG: DUF4440 domain-containing protein [Gemmatimonadota bacterium]
MKLRWIPSASVSFALLLTACQPQAGALSEEDVAAIRNTHAAYYAVALDKDWDAVVTYYAADAVIMPPNQPAVHGRDAIRDWYASFPPVTAVELPIVEIDGRGDMAYVRGTYVLTMVIEGNPEPITDTGKNLAIWRKQEDGSWKMAVDTFNSDLPLTPMEGEHPEEGEHN